MTLLNAFSAIVLDTALKATVLLLVGWRVLILKIARSPAPCCAGPCRCGTPAGFLSPAGAARVAT